MANQQRAVDQVLTAGQDQGAAAAAQQNYVHGKQGAIQVLSS